MNRLTKLLGATVATVLLGNLAPVLVAADDPVIVAVDAPAQVDAGEQFIVRVNITAVTGLDACNYDVTYDPETLEIVGDEGGGAGVTAGFVGATEIPITMWGFVPSETPGAIRIIQNVPGTAGITGAGYLAEIHFRVKVGASGLSTINISNGHLSDKDAGAISAIWNSDSVTIKDRPVPPFTATPTPSPEATPTAPPAVAPTPSADATTAPSPGVAPTPSPDSTGTERATEAPTPTFTNPTPRATPPYTYTQESDDTGETTLPTPPPTPPALAVAQAPVIVSINAPAQITPGSDFIARVTINGVTDFDACNYDVVYDPTVLEIIGSEGGAEGISAGSIGSTEIPVDLWGFVPSGTPGRIRVIQNVPGVAGVSSSGHLAEIHFRVIGKDGDSSAITLENGYLSNKDAQKIPASWVGVSVLCVSAKATVPSSPSPTTSPGSAAPSQPLTSGSTSDNASVPLTWLPVAMGGAAIAAGGIIILRRAFRGQQSS